MTEHFILFGTSGCHLCEQAQALLADSQESFSVDIAIELTDIIERQLWLDEYAVRIPVLLHPESRRELGWPFDRQSLINFVNKVCNQ